MLQETTSIKEGIFRAQTEMFLEYQGFRGARGCEPEASSCGHGSVGCGPSMLLHRRECNDLLHALGGRQRYLILNQDLSRCPRVSAVGETDPPDTIV